VVWKMATSCYRRISDSENLRYIRNIGGSSDVRPPDSKIGDPAKRSAARATCSSHAWHIWSRCDVARRPRRTTRIRWRIPSGSLDFAAARSGRNLAPGAWALRAISAESAELFNLFRTRIEMSNRANVLFGPSYTLLFVCLDACGQVERSNAWTTLAGRRRTSNRHNAAPFIAGAATW
jgi:hypothetical protein